MNKALIKEAIKERDEIVARLKPELDKLNALEGLIKVYNGVNGKIKEQINDIVKAKTVPDYLRAVNHLAKAKEIKEGIGYTAKRDFSQILAELKTAGKIKLYKVDNNNQKTYWGLPEWIGADNKPIAGYEIEEAA